MAPQAAAASEPGRILVNHDDLMTSDYGFGNGGDEGTLVSNVASQFSNGGHGKFLVFTDAVSNYYDTFGPQFRAALASGGHEVVASAAGPFDLATLQTYNGVFLVGTDDPNVDMQVLADYVNAGGNVYVAGGTGSGTTTSYWAPFLNAFGMGFAASDNNIWGVNPVTDAPHALTSGVSSLYSGNGNSVVVLGVSPLVTTLVTHDGQALLVEYEHVGTPTPTPELPTLALATAGVAAIVGLAFVARRRA